MIYVIVENFEATDRIINGGSQSARNLINGLHALGEEVYIISWKRTHHLQQKYLKLINFNPCVFGKILSIEVPELQEWKDLNAIELFHSIVKHLNPQTGIFHLLEAKEYLGCWLTALASTEFKVAVTALDYAWLCANSHLLTRTSERCGGPQNSFSCLQCHYNHKNLIKKSALKFILYSTYLPADIHDFILNNNPKSNIFKKNVKKRKIIEARLSHLEQDFNNIDALIAPSKSLQSFFARNGLAPEKIFHVPYGTQPSTPIDISQRPSEKIVFGFVGKLTFDKGLDILIEALSQVRSHTSKKISLIVYAGLNASGFCQQMMRKINALSWISKRQFNGRDPRSIDEAHRHIHFQVSPSRWTDNLPNAVLEGIERHTPIIAPEYGSFLEMVENGVNGWFYPENTVGELKKILTQIVENPEHFANLPFDDSKTRLPQAEAEDVLQIYQQILPS